MSHYGKLYEETAQEVRKLESIHRNNVRALMTGATIKVCVTEAFIDRRNRRAKLFNPGTRTFEQVLENADCEFLEEYLINNDRKFIAPNNGVMAYDAIHEDLGTIEFKHKAAKTITLKPYCQQQIKANQIDSFLIWKFVSKPRSILQAGDEVVCEIIEVTKTDDIVDRAIESHYNRKDLMVFC